jgi:hypothetical protein
MISIIFITFRENCKFEWFIQSLIQQSDQYIRSLIQIVIVDGLLQNLNDTEQNIRKQYFSELINLNFDFIHVSPKPTHWQGKYKVTDTDYFAASNTRNTGVCFAKYSYIAFHDDLGCPSQTWLKNVFFAQQKNKIQCGAYTKVFDMIVDNGILISKRDSQVGIDSRLHFFQNSISKCNGSNFFGSSFCMPLVYYLQINGMNEMCDGCGAEDYDFGMRLERQGHTLYYNKEMFIYESEDIFGSDKNRKCIRSDPKIDENNPTSNLSHYLLNYTKNGPIIVNPSFSLKDYHYKIIIENKNPEVVFKIPKNIIHFFTKKLISNGL